MHLEVLIDEAFVETAVLVDYLYLVDSVLAVPNTSNATALQQVGALSILATHLETAYELLGRRLDDYARAMSFAHEPLAFINFAVGIEVRADAMAQVIFDFSRVLIFTPASPLLLASGFI